MGVMMGQAGIKIDQTLDSYANAAMHGDESACFDLGVAYSTGANGIALDLVQAHKWFNIAALGGSSEGQYCRAEIAREMTRADIAEAQRQARAWLASIAEPPTQESHH